MFENFVRLASIPLRPIAHKRALAKLNMWEKFKQDFERHGLMSTSAYEAMDERIEFWQQMVNNTSPRHKRR